MMTASAPKSADEQPPATHVLDGAQALPFLTLDGLPAVARALTLVGSVVVVQYDAEWQRLTFYRQAAWLPSGRPHSSGARSEPCPLAYERTIRAPSAHAGGVPGATEVPAGEDSGSAQGEKDWEDGDGDNEGGDEYEDEGSERRSHGSANLAPGEWWAGALTVPITGGTDVVFLQIERHGRVPAGYRGDESVDFSLPVAEIDDVLVLLLRLVAQARRDGVLPSLTAGEHGDEGQEGTGRRHRPPSAR
jgi:hypothetical protein